MAKPKSHDESHVMIICIDCGSEREIRNQDKHQVIRCADCQKEYRKRRRNELRQSSIE